MAVWIIEKFYEVKRPHFSKKDGAHGEIIIPVRHYWTGKRWVRDPMKAATGNRRDIEAAANLLDSIVGTDHIMIWPVNRNALMIRRKHHVL